MRNLLFIASMLGLVSVSGQLRAQTASSQPGFTSQDLDKMSQDNLAAGTHRNFFSGPKPPAVNRSQPLHQPKGMWLCRSTDPDIAIRSSPDSSSPPIARSDGQVAAGVDSGSYTSVLVHEGRIGYLPRSALRPYQNQFNPSAGCTFAGLRPDGMVQFLVR